MRMDKTRIELEAQLRVARTINGFIKRKQGSQALHSYKTPMDLVRALRCMQSLDAREKDRITYELLRRSRKGRWNVWASILFLGFYPSLLFLSRRVRFFRDFDSHDLVLDAFCDAVYDTQTDYQEYLRLPRTEAGEEASTNDELPKGPLFIRRVSTALTARARALEEQEAVELPVDLVDNLPCEQNPLSPCEAGLRKEPSPLAWFQEIYTYLKRLPRDEIEMILFTFGYGMCLTEWVREKWPTADEKKSRTIYNRYCAKRLKITQELRGRFGDHPYLKQKHWFREGRWAIEEGHRDLEARLIFRSV